MKKFTVTGLVLVAMLMTSASSCQNSSAPTNREDCLSQGYEWEEDSDGAECDTDEDDDSLKRKKSKSGKPAKSVYPAAPAVRAPVKAPPAVKVPAAKAPAKPRK